MLDDRATKMNEEEGERLREIPEEGTMEEETYTAPAMRTSLKRRRSNLSSDGDDGGRSNGGGENDDNGPRRRDERPGPHEPSPSKVQLGKLHIRRASASPEKFNKGRFEPLPIRTDASNHDERPLKKARTNLEITYDSTGTPTIATFASIANRHKIAGADSLAARASPLLDNNPKSPTATVAAPYLINPARSPASTAPQNKRFSLLHAICRDNDLLLHFVSYLTIPSLVSLYAISKPFHFLFNQHHTAFILSSVRTWAPNAETVFPWRCYKSLCVKDPSKRQKVRLEGRESQMKRRWDDLRDVPSLRWLQMVVWREGVCRDMLIQSATHGLRCPPGTLDSIKRMWFMLDLPLNAHRIALVRNHDYMADGVLYGITFFLLKVDMHFTDPVQPAYPTNHPNQRLYPDRWAGGMPSGVPLRKMLLAERQLTPLWRVLRGWSWDPQDPQRPMTRMDIMRLWIRHKYTAPEGTPENIKKMSIMGIPWWEVGSAGLERTGVSFQNLGGKQVPLSHPSIAGAGLAPHRKEQILYPHRRQIILEHEKPRERLLRPDELVAKEGVRRKLNMHKQWAWMMFWGFCDDLGLEYPIWTEQEHLRLYKGLPPRPVAKKDEREGKEEAGSVAKQGEATNKQSIETSAKE